MKHALKPAQMRESMLNFPSPAGIIGRIFTSQGMSLIKVSLRITLDLQGFCQIFYCLHPSPLINSANE